MKRLFIVAIMVMALSLLSGCTQAERVSYNLSQEADSFNIARKLTVINQRTDTVLFQITGNISIQKTGDGDLDIIGENADGTFYKHFVYLSNEVTYVVEDLGKTSVNKYSYEINFNPKLWLMNTPDIID
jgi:outer membrane lipoprotein-sorting protein